MPRADPIPLRSEGNFNAGYFFRSRLLTLETSRGCSLMPGSVFDAKRCFFPFQSGCVRGRAPGPTGAWVSLCSIQPFRLSSHVFFFIFFVPTFPPSPTAFLGTQTGSRFPQQCPTRSRTRASSLRPTPGLVGIVTVQPTSRISQTTPDPPSPPGVR